MGNVPQLDLMALAGEGFVVVGLGSKSEQDNRVVLQLLRSIAYIVGSKKIELVDKLTRTSLYMQAMGLRELSVRMHYLADMTH